MGKLYLYLYRHSNASSCIAGQGQRSAVAILLACMSARVCRPKLFKNLCLSLVSGISPLLFRTTPLARGRYLFCQCTDGPARRASCCRRIWTLSVMNKVSPRVRRDDMPPPMAVRLAANLRPSADGSAVRTSLVAGGG